MTWYMLRQLNDDCTAINLDAVHAHNISEARYYFADRHDLLSFTFSIAARHYSKATERYCRYLQEEHTKARVKK